MSEQLKNYVNHKLLQPADGFLYDGLAPATPHYEDYLTVIRPACLKGLAYVLHHKHILRAERRLTGGRGNRQP